MKHFNKTDSYVIIHNYINKGKNYLSVWKIQLKMNYIYMYVDFVSTLGSILSSFFAISFDYSMSVLNGDYSKNDQCVLKVVPYTSGKI